MADRIHTKPHKTSQKNNSNEVTDTRQGSKYRGLTIALILLALFTMAVLATQYYLSSRIAASFSRSSAINYQIYLHDKFIIAMAAAKNATTEAERKKYAADVVNVFRDVNELYDKIATGGEMTISDPEVRVFKIDPA